MRNLDKILITRLINKEYLTDRERREWLGHIEKRIEKLTKALKILKRTLPYYNLACVYNDGKITKEEYELLKEILED